MKTDHDLCVKLYNCMIKREILTRVFQDVRLVDFIHSLLILLIINVFPKGRGYFWAHISHIRLYE